MKTKYWFMNSVTAKWWLVVLKILTNGLCCQWYWCSKYCHVNYQHMEWRKRACTCTHTHTHTHTQSYLLFYISCFLVSIVFNSLSIYLSSCQPPFNFFSFTVFSLIFLSTHHLSHYMSVHHVHHSHIQYILECLLCARSVKKDFNFF